MKANMPLKFSANLSTMFQEIPSIIGRYKAASEAGFKFVECACPYDEPVEKLAEARQDAAVQQVLLNSYPGNYSQGERGLAAISSKRRQFMDSVEHTIQYANALDCKKVHVMAGVHPMVEDAVWMEIYQENLHYAADRLQTEGILALIEAINTRVSIPGYYLDHPKTGHVQIAQVPERNEPGQPGEINYSYILSLLEELGYDGYIGLEYFPTGDTVEGLKWMKDLNLKL